MVALLGYFPDSAFYFVVYIVNDRPGSLAVASNMRVFDMIKIKHGVQMHGLKRSMEKPLDFLDKIFLMLGVDFVVTDAMRPLNGNEKSLHPKGHAIDIRTRDLSHLQKASLLVLLTKYLGNDYDVIQYETHMHIEYQRHLDDNKPANFIGVFGQDKFETV